jgi:hypothetical protein
MEEDKNGDKKFPWQRATRLLSPEILHHVVSFNDYQRFRGICCVFLHGE